MSAVLSAPPASAAALVQSLAPQMREEVFNLLLRELIDLHGGVGRIPVSDSDDSLIGIINTPAAEAALVEKMYAEMPPAVRAAMKQPIGDLDLDDCIPAEEFLEQLRREDAARSQEG